MPNRVGRPPDIVGAPHRDDVAPTRSLSRADRGLRQSAPVESSAWLARVTAEHLRLRWLTGVQAPDEQELASAWRRSVEAFERFGHPFETARSLGRLAMVLRATGHPEEAAELAGRARETARRLRAAPLLDELGALAPTTSSRRSEPSRRDEALTGREDEVLALVALGRSSRDIGRQLFISAKTVSVHVSNLMAKLGASGRTEAVAIARRRGLLPDGP